MPDDLPPGAAQGKPLSAEARRALWEAAARKAVVSPHPMSAEREVGGPAAPEPTRFGDWERKGIATDF